MGIVPLEHQLWMPLHAKHFRIAAHHHSLYQSIRRDGDWHQVRRKVSNRLVMERVHA
jgi:hypothetical protein